jgi:Flp pilus assembly protein TadD
VALGAAFRRRKRWTLALDAYSRAREVAPDDPDALRGLAEVLYQMDSPAAARTHIERACVIRTDDAEIWNTAGRVRIALGDSLGAVAAYRYAAQLKPKDWDIRRYLGYALYISGDLSGALEEMKLSVELNPRAPLSHWALGRMLSDWNRTDEALFHLREATLLDPDDADYWFDLAVAEERSGHLLSSRHALNMALKLDGDYAAGHPELNDLATRLDHGFIAMERTNVEDVVATGPDGFGCEQCRVTPRAGKRPPIAHKRVISPPGQMQYALALCENCRQTYLELCVGMANSGSDAHGEWRAWVPLLGREVDELDTMLALAPASERPALLGRLMRARRRLVEYPLGVFSWCEPRVEEVA